MDHHSVGEGVSDVYGRVQPVSEFDPRTLPRTLYGLVRDRVRRDREDKRREAKSNGSTNAFSWDVVLKDDGDRKSVV